MFPDRLSGASAENEPRPSRGCCGDENYGDFGRVVFLVCTGASLILQGNGHTKVPRAATRTAVCVDMTEPPAGERQRELSSKAHQYRFLLCAPSEGGLWEIRSSPYTPTIAVLANLV